MRLFEKIRHSFVLKQACLLVFMVTLVLGTGFGIIDLATERLLNTSVSQKADLICRENVNQFDQYFSKCESIAHTLAAILAESPSSNWIKILHSTFRSIAASEENVLAVGAATIPYHTDAQFVIIRHKPKSSANKSETDDFQILTSSQYADSSWFTDVVRDRTGKWNEPFQGKIIPELIAVYSHPIFRTMPNGSKIIVGVVCVDIGIDWLDQEVSNITLDYRGDAFLLSDNLQLLSVWNKEDIGKQLQQVDLRKYIYAYDDSFINKMKRVSSQEENSGCFITENKQSGQKARFFWHPMHSTGWIFGIRFPEEAICRPLRYFRSCSSIMSATIFIIIVCSVGFMAHQIRRALNNIYQFAAEIGKGNFSVPVPECQGKDERAMLITTIEQTRSSLQQYIANLKRVTEANERIESELLMAQRIQDGLLPNISPSFPDSAFFEASAKLLPAKEIGGDLFDCTLISPDKLYFIIGDVAGKGIPAALFMVYTQVIQRALRHIKAYSPDLIVSRMNDILFSTNKERLFVTFTCGFIDAQTGIVTYCNAGHTPFFILKKDGTLDEPCQRNGIPLGLRTGINYTKSECRMEPGDTIVFYTDGITEAEDPAGNFYGTKALKDLLRACAGKHLGAEEIVNEIVSSVCNFALNCEQSDDITCLTIHYKKA